MYLLFLTAPCSAMAYHHDSRRIFVGQDNGAIMVSCCDFSSECRLELLRLSMCCWQLIVCFLSIHFGMQLLLNGWASWQLSWDVCGRAAKQRFFWLDVSQVASRRPWAISAAVGPHNLTLPRSCFEGSTLSWAECHGGALTGVVNCSWFAPGQEYGSVCILPCTHLWICLLHIFLRCRNFSGSSKITRGCVHLFSCWKFFLLSLYILAAVAVPVLESIHLAEQKLGFILPPLVKEGNLVTLRCFNGFLSLWK